MGSLVPPCARGPGLRSVVGVGGCVPSRRAGLQCAGRCGSVCALSTFKVGWSVFSPTTAPPHSCRRADRHDICLGRLHYFCLPGGSITLRVALAAGPVGPPPLVATAGMSPAEDLLRVTC
eukprot:11509228-Alexandrium_andersonii.AAC.1